MLEKEIKAKISYNDEDVKKSILFIINRVKKSWKFIPTFIIIIIITLIHGICSGFNNTHFAIVAICIALVIVLFITFYKSPINSYLNFYKKKKEEIYIFSEKGICCGENKEKSFGWNMFIQAYDIPDSIVLADAKLNYYIFPKKCFNDSDVEQLKNLLSENVKNYNKY